MAAAMASTKKDQSLCIHCKKKVHPTDMLQCYDCKSWVHYECTELPNYMLVSLENSQRRFSCKYCVKIPDTFLEKMKQIISSKNSSKDSSTKASIDKLSQLETQVETLHDEKTVLVLQKEKYKKGSKRRTLKQQTIDNLESKHQKINQYITYKKLNVKNESLKTDLKNSKTNSSNK